MPVDEDEGEEKEEDGMAPADDMLSIVLDRLLLLLLLLLLPLLLLLLLIHVTVMVNDGGPKA